MKLCGHCDEYEEPGKVRAMCHRTETRVMANKAAAACPVDGFVCTTEHPPEIATPAPAAATLWVCPECDRGFGKEHGLNVHRFRSHGIRYHKSPLTPPATGGIAAPISDETRAAMEDAKDYVIPRPPAEYEPPLDVPCDEPCGLAKEAAAISEPRPKPTMPRLKTLDFDLRAALDRVIIDRLADDLLDARIELMRHAIARCDTWDGVNAAIDLHMRGIVHAARLGTL
jgi:hypothetical protein